MNSSHYPDLERCKKLKEIKFYTPHTRCFYRAKDEIEFTQIETCPNGNYIGSEWQDGEIFYCPSVMEMLDVIPEELRIEGKDWLHGPDFYLSIGKYPQGYSASMEHRNDYEEVNYEGHQSNISLPNALADLIIWLVENNHLSFNK